MIKKGFPGAVEANKKTQAHLDSGVQGRFFGLYKGYVTDDTDANNQGALTVYVEGVSQSRAKTPGIVCFASSPFFGSSLIDGDNVMDTPVTYGIWGPQPRVGDVVLVMFLDGLQNKGVWIGCLPPAKQTMTMPGLPAMNVEDATEFLPGHEKPRPDTKTKVHRPAGVLAENLKISGLANDLLRGAGISGMTRETPSRVSGWKSRGNPSSGMPGHTFVMDDLPETQGVRLRTSTGHQILLSDTGQSIYISTNKGHSRIELYDNGDIDVFGEGSISVHARKDINLVAGGNLNIDVGGSVNMNVAGDFKSQVDGSVHQKITQNLYLHTTGAAHVKTTGNMFISSDANLDIKAGAIAKLNSTEAMHLKAGGVMFQDASTVTAQKGSSVAATAATAATAPTKVGLPGPKTVAQSVGGGIDKSGNAPAVVQTVASKVPQREPYTISKRVLEEAMRVTEHGEASPFDKTTQAKPGAGGGLASGIAALRKKASDSVKKPRLP